MDHAREESIACTDLRAAVARGISGKRTRATVKHPTGLDRGMLILACGRKYAFMRGAEIDLCPRLCRQRPCPRCARVRASQNARDVEAAMRSRHARRDGVTFVFATLTQPKRPVAEEGARDAVHRIMQAWARVTHANYATGREFRKIFAGGLRSTETTYSAAGDEQRHGAVVSFDGYHAHLHVLLEVREGVSRADACRWIMREWLAECDGATYAAQCVRAARFEDAAELCKYVTKPLEDVGGQPRIVAALFEALHGLRLLAAFGEWTAKAGERLGWRSLGNEIMEDDTPPPPLRRGPEVGDLLRMVSNPIEGSTGRVPFVGADRTDVAWVSGQEAWACIEAAVAVRRAGEQRSRDPARTWYTGGGGPFS